MHICTMERRTACFALIILLTYLEKAKSAESNCSMTNPCLDLGAGAPFQEPVQLSSPESSWSVNLTVDIGNIEFNWLTLKRRLYNGLPVGPTITVKRGDKLALTLFNKLSPAGNNNHNRINRQRYPNSTNIHTHGLHVSAEIGQDNILLAILPNNYFKYRYNIHQNNTPGTNWYHAHVHGSTAFQVNGGLAGLLIVEDDVADMSEELRAASCPENCQYDIQLLFQPLLWFGGRRGYEKFQDKIGDYDGFKNDQYRIPGGDTLTKWLEKKKIHRITTNGQLQPELSMTTGRMYRFRMGNSGGHPPLNVYITGDSFDTPTSNCDIREIACDGVYLRQPRKMHTGQSLLVQGSRVDWLVRCNTPGVYKISSYRRKSDNLSLGMPEQLFTGPMVILNVTGEPVSSSFPTVLPKTFHGDLRNLSQEEIPGRFIVEFAPAVHVNRALFSMPVSYRYRMRINEPQEWTVTNAYAYHSHPLHIHVNKFQVISYNNYTGAYGMQVNDSLWFLNDLDDVNKNCYYQHTGYTPDIGVHKPPKDPFAFLGHDKRYERDEGDTLGYARVGDWRDTILVPPLVNITIRFIPTEFEGDVILHCHILSHEDNGMMMLLEIVPPGASTEADITWNGAYPGACRKCDRFPPNNSTNLCGVTDYGNAEE